MDLIKELRSKYPIKERLLELITNENVSYIDENDYTPLMYAFMSYSKNSNCDSNILSKMLDMNCVPEQITERDNYTGLMFAFAFYGKNPNCDSRVLIKLLDMNCNLEQIDNYGHSTLMYAFALYGKNPNCDSRVLLKLLDMNCNLEQVDNDSHTALVYALKYYGSNPNYDLNVFLKLIDLLYTSIVRPKLIELLDTNTNYQNLKNNIMKAYLYNHRRAIINSRISKRVLKGKYDSLSIFN